ncbi:MAG: putative Ig domain-containing protein [Chloroflexi bacterium]|nr:putative Ig domain-containing protein [Chloroflexota bacterium]
MVKGAPPLGLRLDPDGTLTGAPTNAGSTSFTVQVADALGVEVSRDFSLDID